MATPTSPNHLIPRIPSKLNNPYKSSGRLNLLHEHSLAEFTAGLQGRLLVLVFPKVDACYVRRGLGILTAPLLTRCLFTATELPDDDLAAISLPRPSVKATCSFCQ